MNKFIFVALLLALTAFQGYAEEAAAENDAAIELTSETFANYVKKNDKDSKWLLMFYAPWCGHCKRAKPAFSDFAAEMQGKVNVGRVNCDDHSSVCSRFDVKGYPTFAYVQGGIVYKYQGARNADSWRAFVQGGYKDAESNVLPGELSQWQLVEKKIMQIFQAFQHLYQQQPMVFAGLIGGMTLLCVLSVWCTSKMADGMEPKAEEATQPATTEETSDARTSRAEGSQDDKAQRSSSKDKKKVKRE